MIYETTNQIDRADVESENRDVEGELLKAKQQMTDKLLSYLYEKLFNSIERNSPSQGGHSTIRLKLRCKVLTASNIDSFGEFADKLAEKDADLYREFMEIFTK